MSKAAPSHAAEAARQQALLQALQAGPGAAWLPGAVGLSAGEGTIHAGLRAYRANAQAIAERALTAAYPVLAQMLGTEAMAALARDLWREHPPVRGDLACFGGELAAWLEGVDELAEVPYLADMARLEWAVHRAHAAADPDDQPPDLSLLASADPDHLQLRFVAGSALVGSRWPLVTLWQAHHPAPGQAPDLQAARQALSERRGETAWVWRRGLRVEVAALDPGEAAFNGALQAGACLGPALGEALARHADFSFEAWLTRALRAGWLAAIQPIS